MRARIEDQTKGTYYFWHKNAKILFLTIVIFILICSIRIFHCLFIAVTTVRTIAHHSGSAALKLSLRIQANVSYKDREKSYLYDRYVTSTTAHLLYLSAPNYH